MWQRPQGTRRSKGAEAPPSWGSAAGTGPPGVHHEGAEAQCSATPRDKSRETNSYSFPPGESTDRHFAACELKVVLDIGSYNDEKKGDGFECSAAAGRDRD